MISHKTKNNERHIRLSTGERLTLETASDLLTLIRDLGEPDSHTTTAAADAIREIGEVIWLTAGEE